LSCGCERNYAKYLTAMYRQTMTILSRNSSFPVVFITCENPAHTMMAKREARVLAPLIFNTAVHGGECHTCFTPGRKSPRYPLNRKLGIHRSCYEGFRKSFIRTNKFCVRPAHNLLTIAYAIPYI